MNANVLGRKMLDRNGILYPMLIIAAFSVIIFSLISVAMMTGLLSRAESLNAPHAIMPASARIIGTGDRNCAACGVVEAINAVAVKDSEGNTAAGVAEGNARKTLRYQVRLRMGDGTIRTIHQPLVPAFKIGEKVKMVDGELVAG